MIVLLRTFLLVTLLVIADAKKYTGKTDEAEWLEFKEFQEWKRSRELQRHGGNKMWNVERSITFDHDHRTAQNALNGQQQDPPPVNEGALMGRYIVNQADWTSVATISTRKEIQTFPTVNVISFSDGPLGNGSGIPYLYLTPLDFTAQDLAKDHRASLLMTLAQGDYCKKKVMDPMDPRCARIILSGKIKAIKTDDPEFDTAKKAVFGRHPWLAHMPSDHHFFFAKLKMSSIAVLDTFGGPKYIPINEYLHPPTPNPSEAFLKRFFIDQKNYESDSDEAFKAEPVSNFINPIVRKV